MERWGFKKNEQTDERDLLASYIPVWDEDKEKPDTIRGAGCHRSSDDPRPFSTS